MPSGVYYRVSDEDRFWSFVNKNGPSFGDLGSCWLWTGYLDVHGYGRISVNGLPVLAHRFAWKLKYGSFPSPEGCHKCDNPTCVNVDHLFEGTHSQNMGDMASKRRPSGPRGMVPRNAKLTVEQVLEIKSLLDDGVENSVVAEKFGVGRSIISHIRTGRRWSNVTQKEGTSP